MPIKAYVYGLRCQPDPQSRLAIIRQMRGGHNYKNKLVEIELARREAVNNITRKASPRLAEVEKRLGELNEILAIQQNPELAAERKALNKERKQLRDTFFGSGKSQRLEEILADLRSVEKQLRAGATPELLARRKELRKDRDDEKKRMASQNPYQAAMLTVETVAYQAVKNAYAAAQCHWGTRLYIDAAAEKFRKGRPPKFKRWCGDGAIAVQLQDTPVWNDEQAGPGLKSGQCEIQPGSNEREWIVRMRIGSEGRAPITAEVRAIIPPDRHPPPGSKVKWVYLHRRVYGPFDPVADLAETRKVPGRTSERWQLTLIVDYPAEVDEQRPRGVGAVAVNIGWRRTAEGLRVAYWESEFGQHGELVLPWKWIRDRGMSEGITSELDRLFNEMVAELVEWREKNEERIPEVLKEAMKMLPTWRSRNRLSSLVLLWGKNRFAWDEHIFPQLEGWRRRNRHLEFYRQGRMRRFRLRRLDLYRNFAATLRKNFGTILLDKIDYRELVAGKYERVANKDEAMNRQRSLASPGVLSQVLSQSVAEITLLDPAMHTRKCNSCGSTEPWDAQSSIWHRCEKCGVEFDQDRNACRNMLADYNQLREAVPA